MAIIAAYFFDEGVFALFVVEFLHQDDVGVECFDDVNAALIVISLIFARSDVCRHKPNDDRFIVLGFASICGAAVFTIFWRV